MLNGYEKWPTLIHEDAKLDFTYNAKEMNAILSGFPEFEFIKVMKWNITKEIWDKLMNFYEGDNKVKKDKLQVYRMQFESMKMNEDEDISNIIVNTIRGLDETDDESFVVKKRLRSLPSKFIAKVSTV